MLNRLQELILGQRAHPTSVVKDLADATGLSTESIRRYKRERDSAIDARVALKMAAYFEIEVKDLFEPASSKKRFETLKPSSNGKSRPADIKAKKSV